MRQESRLHATCMQPLVRKKALLPMWATVAALKRAAENRRIACVQQHVWEQTCVIDTRHVPLFCQVLQRFHAQQSLTYFLLWMCLVLCDPVAFFPEVGFSQDESA